MYFSIYFYQARREPQWGPGNHYRGALSQKPHSVGAEIKAPKASRAEREVTWGGYVSPHHSIRGLGERRKPPTQRVRGRAPDENGFDAYFMPERSHLEHPFQNF